MSDWDAIDVAVEAVRAAGAVLLRRATSVGRPSAKGDQYNVVTEADHESESVVVEELRRHFPTHSVLSEECGFILRDPRHVWVIDPLDGTSNFVAGIPWYGVLLALLVDRHPQVGVMYLPSSDELYLATAGQGAVKDGSPIRASQAADLSEVLWACGMDDPGEGVAATEKLSVLHTVLRKARNVRTTNCLLDAAYTSDGRLGGMLNWSCRIWDVAAPSLIVREAGGLYTDIAGQPLEFDLSESAADREYAVLAGARYLHPQMQEAVAAARAQARASRNVPW